MLLGSTGRDDANQTAAPIPLLRSGQSGGLTGAGPTPALTVDTTSNADGRLRPSAALRLRPRCGPFPCGQNPHLAGLVNGRPILQPLATQFLGRPGANELPGAAVAGKPGDEAVRRIKVSGKRIQETLLPAGRQAPWSYLLLLWPSVRCVPGRPGSQAVSVLSVQSRVGDGPG